MTQHYKCINETTNSPQLTSYPDKTKEEQSATTCWLVYLNIQDTLIAPFHQRDPLSKHTAAAQLVNSAALQLCSKTFVENLSS